jgi:hypothetical protein
MKKMFRFLAFLLLVGLVLLALYWKFGNPLSSQASYDRTHQNEDVTTKQQVDAILATFEKVTFKDLDKNYLKYTKSETSKYKSMVKNGTYYKIPSDSIYHKIVGKNRIRNFLPKDKYYKSIRYGQKKYLYWLLDKRILYKVIALQDELEKQGYNRNAFYVRSSFRHPHYNEKIKGASKSRHIKGEAVDLTIQDINQDGKYTDEDKQIVLKIAEKKIIKNEGGIGLYPGTRAVHLDVRGYRARWNTY